MLVGSWLNWILFKFTSTINSTHFQLEFHVESSRTMNRNGKKKCWNEANNFWFLCHRESKREANFRSLKLVELISNIRVRYNSTAENMSRDNKCFKRNILKRDSNKFRVNENRGGGDDGNSKQEFLWTSFWLFDKSYQEGNSIGLAGSQELNSVPSVLQREKFFLKRNHPIRWVPWGDLFVIFHCNLISVFVSSQLEGWKVDDCWKILQVNISKASISHWESLSSFEKWLPIDVKEFFITRTSETRYATFLTISQKIFNVC